MFAFKYPNKCERFAFKYTNKCVSRLLRDTHKSCLKSLMQI